MTMEKYGVEDVKKGQLEALAAVKVKLREMAMSQEKTASELQEVAQLESQVAELEAAIAQ